MSRVRLQQDLPLLLSQQQLLAFLLLKSPSEAVKHCYYGYDVLRAAALGEPIHLWEVEKIEAGLVAWQQSERVAHG